MSDMDEIRFRLAELERKTKGGTLANVRAARLERELASLRSLMEKGFDPDFIERKLIELERGLADHEVRISGLEAGFTVLEDETSRAHARVTDVERVVAEDRKSSRDVVRRVTTLEERTGGSFPFIGLLFALAVGIVAGWLWARHDWSSTIQVGNQNGAAESAADLAISAWLFGAGVGLAVMALIALFSSVSSRTHYDEETIASPPRTQVPVGSVPPTEVHPAQVARTS